MGGGPNLDVDEAGLSHQVHEPAPDGGRPSAGGHHGPADGDRRLGVGDVDGERAPVGVDEPEAASRPEHSHELGHGRVGVVDPLEDPLGAHRVVAPVVIREREQVTHPELDLEVGGTRPLSSVGEHGFAGIDAHHAAVTSDAGRHGARDLAATASGVEGTIAGAEVEVFGFEGAQGDDGRPSGGLIHRVDEQRRVGLVVDPHEAGLEGDVLGLIVRHRPRR